MSLKINVLSFGLLSVALSACGPTPEPEVQVPAPVAEEAPIAEAPVAKPEPPKVERLMGLNPREVQALMGEPGLVRRDNDVQVMLFEGPSCVLEVVFYEPDPGEYFQAKYMAARTRTGVETDTDSCLALLLPEGNWPDS